MRKILSTALLVAAIFGLGAGAALAQAAAPAATPAATAPVGAPSIDWTMQDLLANPGAKAVLIKDLPGLQDDPRLDMVKTMTLRAVAQFPEAQIDDSKLAVIQTDLAALPKP
jgi:para-nitrobenzyl esterase